MNKATHPIKELEILLGSGVHYANEGDTDNACECLIEANRILDGYFTDLGFDDTGNPPSELAEAEARIAKRLGRT